MTKALFFILLCFAQLSFSMPSQILLIRHGEKPDQGNELSPQGWQRAQLLPKLFETRFNTPVALYGMNPSKDTGSVRALQTLKYVAEKLKLTINKDFTRDEISDLVLDIKNNKSYEGKTILICWEHNALVSLAQLLGVNQALNWPKTQFDRVWVLNYKGNTLAKFENLPESLLPGDSN
jgi:hypothetical protein